MKKNMINIKTLTKSIFLLLLQLCTGNLLFTAFDRTSSFDSFAYFHSGQSAEDRRRTGIDPFEQLLIIAHKNLQKIAFDSLSSDEKSRIVALKHKTNISASQNFKIGFNEGFRLGHACQEKRIESYLETLAFEQDLKLVHKAKLRRAHEQLRSYTEAQGLGRQKIRDQAFRKGIQEGIAQEQERKRHE